MQNELTRRDLLRSGAALGAGLTAAGLAADPIIARALAASPRTGRLSEIEHVVILIQENRSFDHVFGSYRGVRGFSDPRGRGAFTQTGYTANGGTLQPFHLITPTSLCTRDITHDWGPQHQSWHAGKMDGFVSSREPIDGPTAAPLTMGYYTREDLPFYYQLADAFTICDGYHCSVLGPTDPNRLYSVSGTLDPDGKAGGPLLETLVADRASKTGTFTWTTMPEQLTAKGITWKSYTGGGGGILDNPLTYFRAFQSGALHDLGVAPVFPDDLKNDAQSGSLPQVSWINGPLDVSEHPGFSSIQAGQILAKQVLDILTSNPAVWKKTALLITWDENGGFFDHVAPPSAPAGTAGEYVTVSPLPAAASGVAGPIGLGFRVPMLVVSPFARGGYVCSDTFDHTSTLRFLEKRFGAEVPNLSAWRRSVTGDLTSAFSFGKAPNSRVPALPTPILPPNTSPGGCATSPATVTIPANRLPTQEPGLPRRPVKATRKPKHHKHRHKHKHSSTPTRRRRPTFTG